MRKTHCASCCFRKWPTTVSALVVFSLAAGSPLFSGCMSQPLAQTSSAAGQTTGGNSEQPPNCSGVKQWPTSMAMVHLQNGGVTTSARLDASKTKTIRLASERLKPGLFRQIHRVTFIEKSGSTIEVITVNEASHEECSMSGVDVYLISRHLGP